jgi:hypothetical protein
LQFYEPVTDCLHELLFGDDRTVDLEVDVDCRTTDPAVAFGERYDRLRASLTDQRECRPGDDPAFGKTRDLGEAPERVEVMSEK